MKLEWSEVVTSSTFEVKKDREELDWIEKVLGRREPEFDYEFFQQEIMEDIQCVLKKIN